jgi:hypothetical protein
VRTGPRRVLVAGASGSGKTTLAARVEAVLGLPHTELDALHHGPNWTPRPGFLADVTRLAAQPEWVCEWQSSSARDLLAARADLFAWLDLPRRTVMRQVVLRTLRRRWRQEVLWNGNVEQPNPASRSCGCAATGTSSVGVEAPSAAPTPPPTPTGMGTSAECDHACPFTGSGRIA